MTILKSGFKYLIVLLFVIPCQAQSTEFQYLHHGEGGDDFGVIAKLKHDGSEDAEFHLSLFGSTKGSRCGARDYLRLLITHNSGKDVVKTGTPLIITYENHKRHVYLRGDYSELPNVQGLIFEYAIDIFIDDLESLNTDALEYEFGSYKLTGVSAAIEEYLEEVKKILSC